MAGQTERLLARARDRFTVQDYYGAIYLLEEIVASGRAFADVHHLIGVCLSLLGPVARRRWRSSRRALELNPRYLEALIHQGLVLSELGRDARGGGVVPPGRRERGAADRRAAGAGGGAARQPARRAGRRLRRGGRAGPGHRAVRARARARARASRTCATGWRGVMLEAGRPLEAREALEEVLRARPELRGRRGRAGPGPLSVAATASARARSGGPASRAGPRTRGSRPIWRCWDAPGA